MKELHPCPKCGKLHEASNEGEVLVLACPFMPLNQAAMVSGETVAILDLGSTVGEPVGEPVEFPEDLRLRGLAWEVKP